MSEAVNALLDNDFKLSSDFYAFLEMAALFQRTYPEFLQLLEAQLDLRIELIRGESSPKTETIVKKRRNYLRLAAEMVIVGIIQSPFYFVDKLTPFISGENIGNDEFLPTLNFLLKIVGNFFTEHSYEIVNATEGARFSELLSCYFKELSRLLVRMHNKLELIEAKGKNYYENKGDLSDKQIAVWGSTKENYTCLKTGLETLATLTGLSLPVLQESSAAPILVEGKIIFTDNKAIKENLLNIIYDSEEDRAFYEDISQLKDLVPSNLTPKTDNIDVNQQEEVCNIAEVDPDAANIVHQSSDASIFKLQESLPAMHTSASVDKIALDLCFLDSKSVSRNLPNILLELARVRADLLPFIARLLATIKPYFPDVCEGVTSSVAGQFFFLLRKTDPIRATRSRICRFIGELTKFRVMTQGKVFECIRRSTENFTGYSVDMLCAILESCGRFLIAQPESHARMNNITEIILRKKQTGHIDQNRVMMIENALYLCKPRVDGDLARIPKKKSPLECYSEWLIRDQLSLENATEIFKRVRKLPFDTEVFSEKFRKLFSKCWKVKVESISALAVLIAGLQGIHPKFVTEVIDDVVEDIFLSLETSYSSWSCRRIQTIRLLSELYVYSAVELDLIFYVLYALLAHGNQMRSAEIEFRIHLVCIILQNVGEYLLSKDNEPIFSLFLASFQRHLQEYSPFTLDTELMLQEVCDRFKINLGQYDEMNELSSDNNSLESAGECSEFDTDAADKNFEKELNQVVSGYIDEHKLEKKPGAFDLSVPIHAKSNVTSKEDVVTFKLLTKKKNRPTTKEISVTIDPQLVDAIQNQQNIQQKELEALRLRTMETQKEETNGPTTLHWNDILLAPIKQPPAPSRSDLERARARKRTFIRRG